MRRGSIRCLSPRGKLTDGFVPVVLGTSGQPWEGSSVRFRLWSLILRGFPSPFREIGMEVIKTIVWLDHTVARICLSFIRSPAWYVVAITGLTACILTAMLFFAVISRNDPTLPQLASKTQSKAVASRDSMEAEGHWAAQDKWRIAHLFVDHRPAKRTSHPFTQEDFAHESVLPAGRPNRNRSAASVSVRQFERSGLSESAPREPDVRLDMNSPRHAEQPQRFVDGQFVRELGAGTQPAKSANRYRSRESRLLVQAEWDFPADCSTEPSRQPLTRRPIPVPEHRWNDQPPIQPLIPDDWSPDLAVTMSLLREFLPAVGEFPPHSRINSETVYSEFPAPENVHRRSPVLARHTTPWSRTRLGSDFESQQPSHVRGAGLQFSDRHPDFADESPAERASHSAPSFAEVALRLELSVPETAVVGQVYRSSVLVHNGGQQPLSGTAVREPLNGLETVTDANPPARIHPDQNVVERQVRHLEAGKDQRLELHWLPNHEGVRQHRAIVTVQADVGAMTEIVAPPANVPTEPETEPVEPSLPDVAPEPVPIQQPVPEARPGLSFDVKNHPRALVDDLVEIQIVVRNTGDTPLHHVRVQAELPQALRHRLGSEVEYVVKELPIGGVELAMLRVTAESAGKAVCRLVASADEPVEASSKAVVDVEPKPAPAELPVQSPRRAAPLPPTPKRIIPQQPISQDNCCCQSQPVLIYEPWFGP